MEHPCYCEICMADRYLQTCEGCEGGHSSFWKTVIESPQWTLWRKEQYRHPSRDMSEVEECGIISPEHFQEFLDFVLKKKSKNHS